VNSSSIVNEHDGLGRVWVPKWRAESGVARLGIRIFFFLNRGRKYSKDERKKGDYSVGASATLHLGDTGRYLVSPHKRSTLNVVTYRALLPCLYTTAVLRSCSVRGNFALGEGSMKNYPTDNHDEVLTDVGCRRGVSRRR